MQILFCLLLFIQICQATDSSNITLSEKNPSWVLFGSELANQTNILQQNDSAWTQINALFNNYADTSFTITATSANATILYTQENVKNGSSQGLIVQGNLKLSISVGSTRDFYLVFAQLPGLILFCIIIIQENALYDRGSNDYQIQEFGKTTKNFTITSTTNRASALTIVNKYYKNVAYYATRLTTVSLSPQCLMTLFANGIPGQTNEYWLYSFSFLSAQSFAPSDLPFKSYTFVVEAGCSAYLTIESPLNPTEISSLVPGSHGFVTSSEYPGEAQSRSDVRVSFEQSLKTSSYHSLSLQANIVNINAGLNGYVFVGFYNSTVYQMGYNISSTTSNVKLNGTGNEIKVKYSVQYFNSTGFLLQYVFAQKNPSEFDISRYSLILDSRLNDDSQIKVFDFNNSIQVNVRSEMNPGVVIFSDATKNITLSDFNNGHAIFQDYVIIYQIEKAAFIAGFSIYSANTKTLLDRYTIRTIDAKNGDYIAYTGQQFYQAITLENYYSDANMNFFNVSVSDNCKVFLYSGGVPYNETEDQLLIYTFDSNSRAFMKSGFPTIAATLVIPPFCNFSAGFSSSTEPETNLEKGSNGFIMSPDWPGYGFPGPVQRSSLYFKIGVNYIKSMLADFNIVLPSISPGYNGYLLFVFSNTSIVNGVEVALQYNITFDTSSTDRKISMTSEYFEVYWNPGTDSNGFLAQYTVSDTHSRKNANEVNLLIIFFYLLAIYFIA